MIMTNMTNTMYLCNLLSIVNYIYNIRTSKIRLLYGLWTIALIILLGFIFSIPNFDGMLASVFAIDLIMALDFVVNAKKTSTRGRIPIAITRLLGDLFAWIAYAQSTYVNVIGIIVLMLNLYYVSICLELDAQANKFKRKRR